MMKNPLWKRLEQRIALALARAVAGVSAKAALSNHSATISSSAIGPAAAPSFSAPAFVTTTGKVRVQVFVTFAAGGGTLAVGDTVTLTILRDGGVTVTPGASLTVEGAATGSYSIAYGWDDTPLVGSHVYAAVATCNNGHTISIVGNGATILLQEQA